MCHTCHAYRSLTIVGSDSMYLASIHELETDGSILERLSDSVQSDMSKQYALSKVFFFYTLRELSRLSRPTKDLGVILSVPAPGACKSAIFRDETTIAIHQGPPVHIHRQIRCYAVNQCPVPLPWSSESELDDLHCKVSSASHVRPACSADPG